MDNNDTKPANGGPEAALSAADGNIEAGNPNLEPLYDASVEEIKELLDAIEGIEDDFERILTFAKFYLSGKFTQMSPERWHNTALATYGAALFSTQIISVRASDPQHMDVIAKAQQATMGLHKDAFLRDLIRLAKKKGISQYADVIAAHEAEHGAFSDEFEDPFHLGQSFFERLLQFKWTEYERDKKKIDDKMAPYKDGLTRQIDFNFKSVKGTPFLAMHILSKLWANVQDKGQFANFVNTFGRYLEANLPSVVMFATLEFMYDRQEENVKEFTERVFKRFIHEHGIQSAGGGDILLPRAWRRKGLVTGLLARDQKFLNDFINIMRHTEDADASFAVMAVGEMLHGLEGEAKIAKLREVVEAVIKDAADWNNEMLSSKLKVMAMVGGCADELRQVVKQVYMDRCDSVVFDFLEKEDEEPVEEKVSERVEQLATECPLLAGTDKEELLTAFKQKITPQEADDGFFQKLRAASLPTDFDPGRAVEEMLSDTSLPLIEARKMDCSDVLTGKFKVVIEPNPACPASLVCFRIRIIFKNLKKGKLTLQQQVLDFEKGRLTTEMASMYKETCNRIGLFFGHLYFVKALQEIVVPSDDLALGVPAVTEEAGEVAEEVDAGVDAGGDYALDGLTEEELELLTRPDLEEENVEIDVDAGDEDEEAGDEEASDEEAGDEEAQSGDVLAVPEEIVNGPDSEPRDYEGRTMAPLTIDLRDSDDEEIEEEGRKLSKTLGDNKAVVIKLLKGQIDDVDFDGVILHRITEKKVSEKRSINIYERVPAEEIMDAAADGTLADKDWFLINTLPHMKALGYRKFMPKPKDPASPPYWAVGRSRATRRAQMAYESYQQAGFPQLSSFHEFQAVMGIMADAEYERGLMMVQYGDEVKMMNATRRDLNAALAKRMTEEPMPEIGREPWLAKWTACQKKEYEKEIDEIMESNLSDDEKLFEIALRERKIADLPELAKKIHDQTFLARQGTSYFVRLTLGWVPTETSFNQGTFVSVRDLAASLEFKKKAINE